MILKRKLLTVCTIFVIFLLVVEHCDALKRNSKSSGKSKSSVLSKFVGGLFKDSSHVKTKPKTSTSQSEKKIIRYSTQSHSKASSPLKQKTYSTTTPRHEERKTIGRNTNGLSNPNLQNAPTPIYKPLGHQDIQSNSNLNQYQGSNYPGINTPKNVGQQHSGYPESTHQGGHNSHQGGNHHIPNSGYFQQHSPAAPSSAPREEKKTIGWNTQSINNTPSSATNTPPHGEKKTYGWDLNTLSNQNLQNAPTSMYNHPLGHQAIQSNSNSNQYQNFNNPRNTSRQSVGHPVQSNMQSEYPEINIPKNVGQQHSGYPESTHQGGHNSDQGGHYHIPNSGYFQQHSPAAPSSAPREEKKTIGWNTQSISNTPSSATNTPPHGEKKTYGWDLNTLSNQNLQNAPTSMYNHPLGHQAIQSNSNSNQYQNFNNPRNTSRQWVGHPVQSNMQSQYPGINNPKDVGQQHSGYPGGTHQGGHNSHQVGHHHIPNSGYSQQHSPPAPSSAPSEPRSEEKKTIGWNTQSINNTPSSATNTPPHGEKKTYGWDTNTLSNQNLPNAPTSIYNHPLGHQAIQSNSNSNQYQNFNNNPRNTPRQSVSHPVQSNMQSQYPETNNPKNVGQQQSGYPGGTYQASHYSNQGGYYQNTGEHYHNQADQDGHYSGMNYGGGIYPGYFGYSPAAPNGYFASGYPVTILSDNKGRSRSGKTVTNALLAGTFGLELYNALQPRRLNSGSSHGRYGNHVSITHNHYHNSQAEGSNRNSAQGPGRAQGSSNYLPDQASIPLANNNLANRTNVLVTPPPATLAPNDKITDLDCVYAMKILNCSEIAQCPRDWLHPSCINRTIPKDYFDSIMLPPPPTVAPNDKITDLDCVYAMKILNCSEISQCPQEWLHPSCTNRTISKKYFDCVTLPPPPPLPAMPQADQIRRENLSRPSALSQSKNEERILKPLSSKSQQAPLVSSSRSSSSTGHSLYFAIILGIAVLKSAY